MEPDDTSKVRDLVETKMISICLCGGNVIDTKKEYRGKGKFRSCNENFTLIWLESILMYPVNYNA